MVQESQYSIKMETSSPGGHASHLGEDQDTSPSKLSKEELIQSMDRVDREIAKVEQQIFKLKKKQVGGVGAGEYTARQKPAEHNPPWLHRLVPQLSGQIFNGARDSVF